MDLFLLITQRTEAHVSKEIKKCLAFHSGQRRNPSNLCFKDQFLHVLNLLKQKKVAIGLARLSVQKVRHSG